ncbi:MAG: M23 family metallopeptidase [Actinobacteria bacterium]|nr:M23 family metallopeptidase [Actinomycetota bacterium]
MADGQAGRFGRLARLAMSVVALSTLLVVSNSVELSHQAHAADLPARQPLIGTARTDPPSTIQLAEQRAASLRQAARLVQTAAQQSQLQDHRSGETEQANAIQAEVDRLNNLTEFAWPTNGGVSSGFGMRKHPILGYVRLHNGADIGGACGNPIYAAQSGTVTKAGYSSSSGNNIRIDHSTINGKRVETAYLHMSKLAVRNGQRVNKGDTIGYVGTTGLSTACHLHLALYEDGSGSDPLDYLRRR